MSVPKPERSESKVKFITLVTDLRITTERMVHRFPKSYRYTFTNNVMQLVTEAYTKCVRANDIFLHKNSPQADLELRRSYFIEARTAIKALRSEITYAWSLASRGNNWFKSTDDMNHKFEMWIAKAVDAYKCVNAVIKSDQRRLAEIA